MNDTNYIHFPHWGSPYTKHHRVIVSVPQTEETRRVKDAVRTPNHEDFLKGFVLEPIAQIPPRRRKRKITSKKSSQVKRKRQTTKKKKNKSKHQRKNIF